MTLQQRINALSQLGTYLSNNDKALTEVLQKIQYQNGWFTLEQTQFCLNAWTGLLNEENLTKWTANYSLANPAHPKKVGLILAGNIPLVGFHDVLAVLLSGHIALIKLSSQDNTLLPFLLTQLSRIAPELATQYQITERLNEMDAVIATGSNNSARYFDYYFGKYPHIIRKNRNSVAILTGDESKEELQLLGEDIFRYYGLGCRNVSKIYVPRLYNFSALYEALEPYKTVLENNKYTNNYEYNRTLLLMNSVFHYDNRFLMISENAGLASPIASLHYEEYDFVSEAEEKIQAQSEQIQCVVGSLLGCIPFGKSQQPELWDYADGVDTMEFLKGL